MLSPKRLVEKAKKGISFKRSKSRSSSCSDHESTAMVADKSYFTMYTEDNSKFMVALASLKSPIFQELLRISEEEFGLPGDGPIILVCSAVFMELILTLLRKQISGDIERALLESIGASRCSLSGLAHPGSLPQRAVA